MRLKENVTKKDQGEKTPPTVEELRRRIKSLDEHNNKLQGAKLGAEGLYNVMAFCAEAFEARESAGQCLANGQVIDPLLEGLAEVALMLYKTVGRATDAVETELGELHERLDPEFAAQRAAYRAPAPSDPARESKAA